MNCPYCDSSKTECEGWLMYLIRWNCKTCNEEWGENPFADDDGIELYAYHGEPLPQYRQKQLDANASLDKRNAMILGEEQ